MAILKISAVSLKYHIFEDAFFICIIISTGSLAKQVKKVVFLHSVAFVLNSKIKVGKNDNFGLKMKILKFSGIQAKFQLSSTISIPKSWSFMLSSQKSTRRNPFFAKVLTLNLGSHNYRHDDLSPL